jgi:hypothetical protein
MKDLKIYISLASIVLIIYLVAQFNKPKPTDWSTTLSSNDKIPFGTYILYNRITDIFPGAKVKTFREPVYNVIDDENIENGTYMIIGDDIDIDTNDYVQLKKYIEKGNDVFIAANTFSGELAKILKINTENDRSPATRIGFINNQWKDNLYDVDKYSSNGYFADFDTAKAVVLGNNQYHHFNYIRFPMGKGNLYLNANPQMFTNYSLLQDMGAAYSSIALSYVKNSKNLYWDQYYTLGREGAESPMRVFLQNNSLRWAFYIAIFSLLVFVLYEMKRRQRIIPIIPPLNNTTVEFAGIVGQVYYEQRNNGNIAQKKAAYFLEHIRSTYNIRTQVFDEEFITTLSQKSGAKPELVKDLANQITHVNITSQISDNELIDLNRNIEQFYIQSR